VCHNILWCARGRDRRGRHSTERPPFAVVKTLQPPCASTHPSSITHALPVVQAETAAAERRILLQAPIHGPVHLQDPGILPLPSYPDEPLRRTVRVLLFVGTLLGGPHPRLRDPHLRLNPGQWEGPQRRRLREEGAAAPVQTDHDFGCQMQVKSHDLMQLAGLAGACALTCSPAEHALVLLAASPCEVPTSGHVVVMRSSHSEPRSPTQ
jgi:hypothetical protein